VEREDLVNAIAVATAVAKEYREKPSPVISQMTTPANDPLLIAIQNLRRELSIILPGGPPCTHCKGTGEEP
jgi:hypothetical protein